MVISIVIAALASSALTAGAFLLLALRSRKNAAQSARPRDALGKRRDMGQLAGGLAHEIRNPLSSMNMNLQLLAEDLSAPTPPSHDKLQARVRTVQREVHRLSDILDDFLRFARPAELTLAEEDINQIVNEVLEFISPDAIRANIRLLKTCSPDLPKCSLDRDALRRALLNIFLNAQEAMPSGGELMVRTLSDKDSVRIDVIDTGKGIPPEALSRIFDAYFSTKKDGSGLGLATTKAIIEEHNGRISVYSEPGKGTRVSIYLPPSGRGR